MLELMHALLTFTSRGKHYTTQRCLLCNRRNNPASHFKERHVGVFAFALQTILWFYSKIYTYEVKICLKLVVYGQVMGSVTAYSGCEWNTGQRSEVRSYPAKHDTNAGTRSSAVTVETREQTETGPLHL